MQAKKQEMRIILCVLSIVLTFNSIGQINSSNKTFNCESIFLRINENKGIDSLKNYDLCNCLMLDTTYIKNISRTRPSVAKYTKQNLLRTKLSNETIGFKTRIREMKNLISNDKELKKILIISDTQIEMDKDLNRITYPIYYYKNKAIIEITSDTEIRLFIARLNDNTLQLNYFQGIQWDE